MARTTRAGAAILLTSWVLSTSVRGQEQSGAPLPYRIPVLEGSAALDFVRGTGGQPFSGYGLVLGGRGCLACIPQAGNRVRFGDSLGMFAGGGFGSGFDFGVYLAAEIELGLQISALVSEQLELGLRYEYVARGMQERKRDDFYLVTPVVRWERFMVTGTLATDIVPMPEILSAELRGSALYGLEVRYLLERLAFVALGYTGFSKPTRQAAEPPTTERAKPDDSYQLRLVFGVRY